MNYKFINCEISSLEKQCQIITGFLEKQKSILPRCDTCCFPKWFFATLCPVCNIILSCLYFSFIIFFLIAYIRHYSFLQSSVKVILLLSCQKKNSMFFKCICHEV